VNNGYAALIGLAVRRPPSYWPWRHRDGATGIRCQCLDRSQLRARPSRQSGARLIGQEL